MSPRRRKAENKWMEEYPGLHVRYDGVFELKHPVTKLKTGLDTKNRDVAIRAWQAFMPKWIAEAKDHKAERLANKLANMENIELMGMDVTLTQYAKDYRLEVLPTATKADGKTPLSPRTKSDNEKYLRVHIEPSPILQIPLADKYADVRIRQFLSQWENNPATYNHHRNMLNTLYKHAILSGKARTNPLKDIESLAKPKRLVYLNDTAYSSITKKMLEHEYLGEPQNGEWAARIVDLTFFSGCRPADALELEDSWFDENGILTYRANKNQKLVQIEDLTGAIAETVLWLREFKRQQKKISKYLCIYPRYMGKRMFTQARAHERTISRIWSAACIDAGYFSLNKNGNKEAEFKFKDLRKKSLAEDSGQNKGAHSEAMQKYYEGIIERPHKVKNNLVNPRFAQKKGVKNDR